MSLNHPDAEDAYPAVCRDREGQDHPEHDYPEGKKFSGPVLWPCTRCGRIAGEEDLYEDGVLCEATTSKCLIMGDPLECTLPRGHEAAMHYDAPKGLDWVLDETGGRDSLSVMGRRPEGWTQPAHWSTSTALSAVEFT